MTEVDNAKVYDLRDVLPLGTWIAMYWEREDRFRVDADSLQLLLQAKASLAAAGLATLDPMTGYKGPPEDDPGYMHPHYMLAFSRGLVERPDPGSHKLPELTKAQMLSVPWFGWFTRIPETTP